MTRSRLLSSCALAALFFACPPPPGPACDGGACPADAGTTLDCAPGTFRAASGECRAAGASTCAAGFTRDPSGWGCAAELSACDAGAIWVPGEGCTPAGWSTCPAGFVDDGWSCEPVLPSTPCTGATRASLGSSSCVPVGDCGAAFPPPGATLFVDAALDGGDATHFSSLTAALAAAPPGATIAVSPGTYREALTPTKAVKLVGRCAAQVQLIGSPAVFADAIGGVELEGFTVRDSVLAARVERGGGLTLRHVVLEANLRSAVQAVDPGSRVTLEDVVVRGTLPDPSTQTFGQGIAASFGAQVELTDVELSGNREIGLFLDRAQTRGTLARTVVSGTLPRASTGALGWGIAVQRGAALVADRLVVQDSRATGLLVAVSPSAATLTDTLVRRTTRGLDNQGKALAYSVAVLQGGALSWTRGAAEGTPGSLVHAQDPGSAATLREVTARDVTQAPGLPPSGIDAEGSARVSLERVAVLRTAGSALFASAQGELTLDHVGLFEVSVGLRAQGARVTGDAVELRGHADVGALAIEQGALSLQRCVLADGLSDVAFGAAASELGSLELTSCVIPRARTAGVYARTPGAAALLFDTVITDTQLNAAGEFGQGVIVERGARATLVGVTVARNHTAGLQVAHAPSELSASRVTVHGTQPNGAGTRGRGANANFGGALVVSESAFIDNRQVGLFAYQSSLVATDCVVSGTKADPDGAYGNGVESLTDGRLTFRGGAIEGSAGIAAVFAGGAGALDAVRVAKNAIGLHGQDGSTVEELPSVPPSLGARQVVVTSSTRFEDNQAKVSALTVTVPPP